MKSQVTAYDNSSKTLFTTSKKVSCNGSEKTSGHPFVYLNMGKNDSVTCPYCSRFFAVKKLSDQHSLASKSQ